MPLAALAPAAIGALRERMRLPERPGAFPGKRDFKLLFTTDDPSVHVLFGEAEHWIRVQVSKSLPTTEDALADEDDGPKFARSEEWGWLTSDPVFAGPGVQFEAGLHLPALAATGRIAQAQRAMDAMGHALYPLSMRNPGTAEAGFFRLLSGGALGASREEATERFNAAARALLAAESRAWERWIAREPNLLDDRMHRALRLLQEARRMDYAELLFLSSFARAGAYAGIFPSALLPRLEELRVRTQPHHLGVSGVGMASDPEEESLRRAAASRTLLQGALLQVV
jgi:protein-arginine kinase